MKLFMRQGDIYVFQVKEVKGELQKVDSQLIAEGETTGHKHLLIKDREDTEMEIAFDGTGFYLNVKKGQAKLVHEEHKTLTFDTGLFFIKRQREYDPIIFQRQVND